MIASIANTPKGSEAEVRMGSVSTAEINKPWDRIGFIAITTGARSHCQNNATALTLKRMREGKLDSAKPRHENVINSIPGKRTM